MKSTVRNSMAYKYSLTYLCDNRLEAKKEPGSRVEWGG